MRTLPLTLLMLCWMCPGAWAQEVGPGTLEVGSAIPLITTGVVVGVTAVTAGVVTTTGGSLGSTTASTSGKESASHRRARLLRYYVELNRAQVEQHVSMGAGACVGDIAAILELPVDHHKALARHLRLTRATLLSLGDDHKKTLNYIKSALSVIKQS